MKTLLSIMLLFCSMSVSYPANTSLSIVTNYAYMYEDASFTSAKYDFQIKKNETVTIINETEENGFYLVSYSYDNDDYEGYVYKECLGQLEDTQQVVLSYNAKTSARTKIYSITDKSDTGIYVDESTELYLYEGFDRKSEFTAVKLSYEGEIILGYIKTADVSPYGVNNILIISITAIIACVGVIMILLGINKKKLRKSPVEENNN